MTGAWSSAGASPDELDGIINGVRKATDLNSISTAAQAWSSLGTALVTWLTADPAGQEGSLGYHLNQHLTGWKGSGSEAFAEAVGKISDFGKGIGLNAYDLSGEQGQQEVRDSDGYNAPPLVTFHTAHTTLQGNLQGIFDLHDYYYSSYHQWLPAVAGAILDDINSYNLAGGNPGNNRDYSKNPAFGWSAVSYSWVNTPTGVLGDSTSVYTVTLVDESKVPAQITLTGWTSTDGYSVANGVNESASQVADLLRKSMTALYTQRVGPLADQLIGHGNTVYDQAHQLLPAKADESKLPGTSQSANNGSNGAPGYPGGYGSGAGSFPGGLGPGSYAGAGSGAGSLPGSGYGSFPGGMAGSGSLPGSGSGSLPGSGPGSLPGSGSGSLPGSGSAPGSGFGALPGSGSGPGTGWPGSGSGASAGPGSPSGSGSGSLPGGLGALPGAPTQLAGYVPPHAGTGSGHLGGFGAPGGIPVGGAGPGGLGPGGAGAAGAGAGGFGAAGLGGAGGALGSGDGAFGPGSALGSAGAAGAGGLTAAAGRAGMPMMPPMMPPQGGNQDKDRQRKSWLPEDEDIWGTDGSGVPPVISGDA